MIAHNPGLVQEEKSGGVKLASCAQNITFNNALRSLLGVVVIDKISLSYRKTTFYLWQT